MCSPGLVTGYPVADQLQQLKDKQILQFFFLFFAKEQVLSVYHMALKIPHADETHSRCEIIESVWKI